MDFSKVSIFGFFWALIQVGFLQLQFGVSLITPLFRGDTKSVNGFSLWRKGDLSYVQIMKGTSDTQFVADVSYGYEQIAFKGDKLKITPRKKSHQIENNIVKFDSYYYTLSNNHLFKMDEKLVEKEYKRFDLNIEHVFSDSSGLYVLANDYFKSEFYVYKLDNEMNVNQMSPISHSDIMKLSDGFISNSNRYNSKGEKVDSLTCAPINPYSTQLISTTSEFFIHLKSSSDNEKETSENKWEVEIVTLSDSINQNKVFVSNLSTSNKEIRNVDLVLSPNQKYYVYSLSTYDDKFEIWQGSIFKEEGIYKSKEKKIGSFDYVEGLQFSRNGEVLASKVQHKGKIWFAFKNVSGNQ